MLNESETEPLLRSCGLGTSIEWHPLSAGETQGNMSSMFRNGWIAREHIRQLSLQKIWIRREGRTVVGGSLRIQIQNLKLIFQGRKFRAVFKIDRDRTEVKAFINHDVRS